MFAIQTDREWRRFCVGRHAVARRWPMMRAMRPTRARVANRVDARGADRSALSAAASAPTSSRCSRRPTFRLARSTTCPAVVDASAARGARALDAASESPGGDIPALIPPHNLQHVPPRMGRVPALGEHTSEVLAAHGDCMTSAHRRRSARSMLFVPASRWAMIVKGGGERGRRRLHRSRGFGAGRSRRKRVARTSCARSPSSISADGADVPHERHRHAVRLSRSRSTSSKRSATASISSCCRRSNPPADVAVRRDAADADRVASRLRATDRHRGADRDRGRRSCGCVRSRRRRRDSRR